jgi:hypothetical protein
LPKDEKPRYPEYTGKEPCVNSINPDVEWFGHHDSIDSRSGSIPLATAEQCRIKCGTCPMLEPCMKWAVLHNERSGVWGGTTPEERKVIRRLQDWPDWDYGKRVWVLRLSPTAYTKEQAS